MYWCLKWTVSIYCRSFRHSEPFCCPCCCVLEMCMCSFYYSRHSLVTACILQTYIKTHCYSPWQTVLLHYCMRFHNVMCLCLFIQLTLSAILFFCLVFSLSSSWTLCSTNTHIHTLTHIPSESLSADAAIEISHSQQKKALWEMNEGVFIFQVFSDSWGTSSKFLSPLDKVCSALLNSNDAYYLPLCPQLFGNSRALSWMLDVPK